MRDYKNVTCGFTEKPCALDQCPVWVKLDDFEGCPLDIADRAIKDFGINTLAPLAVKADGLVKAILSKIPLPK